MTNFPKNISLAVGVSISESPDMQALGLSQRHLRDAMAEIALHILASGLSLVYGGDLRAHGFTSLLFELLTRYRDHPEHRGTITVTDYLAWPVHIRMTEKYLTTFSEEHENTAQLILLSQDGGRLDWQERLGLAVHEPDENEWAEGLTSMRQTMCEETSARVVVGGRVAGYKGNMPGIAEETLLSLQTGQPVYLLGGFGGCTRDIAETVGLVGRWAGSRNDWAGRDSFRSFKADDLHNGLSPDENVQLARTPHIVEAVTLMRRGLKRKLNGGGADAQGIH